MTSTEFKALHYASTPLVIGNVWDCMSAKAAEAQGFSALGTSSAAIASMLGYEDGEEMPFDQLFYLVQRILSVSTIPVSVDIESGYSDSALTVAAHISRLADLGVVGINLEDSHVRPSRHLKDKDEFARFLERIKESLLKSGTNIFVNVRTDGYLLGIDNASLNTQVRAKLYESAGADGLFVPCLTDLNDMKDIANCTNLPLNVMAMPGLPAVEALSQAGVKRISSGNFLQSKAQAEMESWFGHILNQGSFRTLFC